MRFLILLFSLLMLPAVTMAEGGEKSESGTNYIEIAPKVVVNLADSKQILAINVQLLVEGGEVVEGVKKNMPALKNALIMLYSSKKIEEIKTAEQREALRKETFEVVKKTLEKYAGSDEGFKDVFFTDFMIN